MEKVVVSAVVSRDTRQELERLAAEGDRSLSAEVRRALTRHVLSAQSPPLRGTRRLLEPAGAAAHEDGDAA